ncbi:MAG: PrsW family glutamic-type intramembrane protease [Planctomycetota bacterium]
MMTLQYLLLGFAPGLFWLWYFRRKDDLEPEPRAQLLKVFLFGCVAPVIVLAVRPAFSRLLPTGPGWRYDWIDAFLVTSLPEEGAKLLVFFLVAYLHHDFDEPLDGIIYGTAVALGFASVENVIYLFRFEDASVVVIRAFTATLGHAGFTGSLGFFWGLAKFSARRWRLLLMGAGFGVAVVFHGAYDVLLFGSESRSWLALFGLLPLILVLLSLKMRWLRARSPFLARAQGRSRQDS